MTVMFPCPPKRHPASARPYLAGLLVIALGILAGAEGAAAEDGQSLVEQHCTECHTREGFALPGQPPTLPEMARRRSWPGGELKAWLATDHARIPTPRLTSRQFYEIEQYLHELSRAFPEF